MQIAQFPMVSDTSPCSLAAKMLTFLILLVGATTQAADPDLRANPGKGTAAGQPRRVDLEITALDAQKEDDPGAFLLLDEASSADYVWTTIANTADLVLHVGSEFPVGAQVTLSVSDPAKVRVFDATMPTPVAVIGPTTAASPEQPVSSWGQVLENVPGNLYCGDLTFRVQGVATDSVELTLRCATDAGVLGQDSVRVTVVAPELDIRETALPANCVGRDDPRVRAGTRNKVLVWATEENEMDFELFKLPGVYMPLWVSITDISGENADSLPLFEMIEDDSKTYRFLAKSKNDGADLRVEYGIDRNGDGVLDVESEVIGVYEVYGVTRSEYAESRSNYDLVYLQLMWGTAFQLHHAFLRGEFSDAGVFAQYKPDAVTICLENADCLTHNFGADCFTGGFYTRDIDGRCYPRKYYSCLCQLSSYYYGFSSPGSSAVAESAAVASAIQDLVGKIEYSQMDTSYESATGGECREVAFDISNVYFKFPAAGGVGLGAASATPGSYIVLTVTKSGTAYLVGRSVSGVFRIRDYFDFDYFNPSWLSDTIDASRSAAMIQSGFRKDGSVSGAGGVARTDFDISTSTIVIDPVTLSP